MVCCWNEYLEGNVVEPTKKYGSGYLDAIKAVFGVKDPSGAIKPSSVSPSSTETAPTILKANDSKPSAIVASVKQAFDDAARGVTQFFANMFGVEQTKGKDGDSPQGPESPSSVLAPQVEASFIDSLQGKSSKGLGKEEADHIPEMLAYNSIAGIEQKLKCATEVSLILGSLDRWKNKDLPNSCPKYREEISSHTQSNSCQDVKVRDLSPQLQESVVKIFHSSINSMMPTLISTELDKVSKNLDKVCPISRTVSSEKEVDVPQVSDSEDTQDLRRSLQAQ
jgi:hypothetical protein